jgi:hypothetical protein
MCLRQRGPIYCLEIETVTGNAPPVSRLKRALKMLSWYRLKVRSIQEVPSGLAHSAQAEQSSPQEARTPDRTTEAEEKREREGLLFGCSRDHQISNPTLVDCNS